MKSMCWAIASYNDILTIKYKKCNFVYISMIINNKKIYKNTAISLRESYLMKSWNRISFPLVLQLIGGVDKFKDRFVKITNQFKNNPSKEKIESDFKLWPRKFSTCKQVQRYSIAKISHHLISFIALTITTPKQRLLHAPFFKNTNSLIQQIAEQIYVFIWAIPWHSHATLMSCSYPRNYKWMETTTARAHMLKQMK